VPENNYNSRVTGLLGIAVAYIHYHKPSSIKDSYMCWQYLDVRCPTGRLWIVEFPAKGWMKCSIKRFHCFWASTCVGNGSVQWLVVTIWLWLWAKNTSHRTEATC